MHLPLSELRGSLASWLPRALASPEAVARVERLFERLPDDFSCAAFECRLGGAPSRVDFLACVTRADRQRFSASLAELGRRELVSGPAWARVSALCADWAEPATLLHGQLPLIWLEFDCPPEREGIAEPFVFLCVQPDYPGPLLSLDPASGIPRRLVEEGLAALVGGPLAPGVEARVRRCFAELPPRGYVLHAAPLSSRGLDAVRLVLTFPAAEVPGYLDRIGWPGSKEEVAGLLEDVCAFTGTVGFALDVGASVHPVIGLESYWVGKDPRWLPLFEALIRRRACTAGERDAVLSWPGTERRAATGEQWPLTIDRMIQLKLVQRPAEPLQAKAYLGMSPMFSLFD